MMRLQNKKPTNYNDEDVILSTYVKRQFISNLVCYHLISFFMGESILNLILKCTNLMIIHAEYLLCKRSYKILQRPYLLKFEYLALLLFILQRLLLQLNNLDSDFFRYMVAKWKKTILLPIKIFNWVKDYFKSAFALSFAISRSHNM
jgi:hypothetical protein